MKRIEITEKTRFVLLVLLAMCTLGMLWYVQNGVEQNFIDTL
jgi:K+-transporting ATPase A subunit